MALCSVGDVNEGIGGTPSCCNDAVELPVGVLGDRWKGDALLMTFLATSWLNLSKNLAFVG